MPAAYWLKYLGADIMEIQAIDVIKIKGFLKQYIEVLKASGKTSDSYAIDVIEDLLTRL